MVEIVIASGNRHKCRELAALCRVDGIRWRTLADMPGIKPARETGRTFMSNAVIKARAIASQTGGLVLADDSGLEVDALDGGPGIRSARFAGRHGDDRANNELLLAKLAGRPARGRRARYRCVLALASPHRVVAAAEGTWEGRIAAAPSGRHGFGYDPVFLVPRMGKTVGELPARVKHRLSHRAAAARRLRPVLRRLLRDGVTAGTRTGSAAARRLRARRGS